MNALKIQFAEAYQVLSGELSPDDSRGSGELVMMSRIVRRELTGTREQLERCKAALESLYSHQVGPDEWGIKCIEDHNAIIVEALGYIPAEEDAA